MEKIIIERLDGGWNVIQGDKNSDHLCYEEMLGLVVALTFPEANSPCLSWMKTEVERKKHDEYLQSLNK